MREALVLILRTVIYAPSFMPHSTEITPSTLLGIDVKKAASSSVSDGAADDLNFMRRMCRINSALLSIQ